MSFVVYDIAFMTLFILLFVIFIVTRKHNLHRQGMLFLYRTRLGIKFIEWTSNKFAKVLRPLEYLVVACGYVLMIGAVWVVIDIAYIYIKSPFIAKVIEAPPIFPIFPYFTEFFNLESFFPPFYFTYFVVVIAIIAVSHEFAHGIFARLNKVKIHSTGFAFLGPFIGAFVEQDDKQMNKAKKFSQLSILAAGTFANIVMMVLFALVMWWFFAATFAPVGINFDTYTFEVIPAANLSFQGIPITSLNLSTIPSNASTLALMAYGKTYHTHQDALKNSLAQNSPYLMVFEDSPAFKAQLTGAITEIDGKKVTSYESLRNILQDYKEGDRVKVKTLQGKEVKEYEIELAEKDGRPYLGISSFARQRGGILGGLYKVIYGMKDPYIEYSSKIGDFGVFIYNLLWWIILLNLLVAFTNMLPVGIFDGGRFFFITIWGITKSKRTGERAFAISTWAIIAIVALMMVRWFFTFFFQ
ncbi:MAG: site-2 protease family protein [Nanoarchaeota archaeon]|nr:site-2 protease family protein [Nanoarchaeota archaeon]